MQFLDFSIKTTSLRHWSLYRQLEQVRCLPGPNWRITNPTSFKIMQQFQLKKSVFAVVKTEFSLFTDYWLIGRVVLDPTVHYLGPRVVGSSYNGHISIGLRLCFNR